MNQCPVIPNLKVRLQREFYRILWIRNRIVFPLLYLIRARQPETPLRLSPILVVTRVFPGSHPESFHTVCDNLQRIFAHETTVMRAVRPKRRPMGQLRWLKQQVQKTRCGMLVIADPYLLGGSGLLGLLNCLNLVRFCRRKKIALRLMIFDLIDPQSVLAAKVCSQLGVPTLLLCSTASEAKNYFGISHSFGPAPEALIDVGDRYLPKWSERTFDLHLPKPSYEPRTSFVCALQDDAIIQALEVTVGGTFESEDDYYATLLNTKIVVATNYVASVGRGSFPMPLFPNRHLVRYNAEALNAGALLLSQDCDAYRSVFCSGVDSLSYRTLQECASMIADQLNHPEAEEISRRGTMVLRNRWEIQPVLREWIAPEANINRLK